MPMTRRFASALGAFAIVGIVASAPAPAAYAATSVAVTIERYAFTPAALTVHVGDTIVWTNMDVAPHDVTTTSAPVSLHSPTITTGASWRYTFTVAGTYAYICSVHPDMHASLTVLAAASPAPPHTMPATAPAAAPASVAVFPPVRAVTLTPVPRYSATSTAAGTARLPLPVPASTVAAAVPSPPKGPTLKPMLLVAGLISAIAILCLLVLASKPEATRPN